MTDAARRRFLRQVCGAAFAGALTRVSAGADAPAETAPAAEHIVVIEGMRFTQQALTVKQGDRIVWRNNDLLPHSVTADAKTFDSGSIAPNASWAYVAKTRGTYPYACAFHPTMKATLRVL